MFRVETALRCRCGGRPNRCVSIEPQQQSATFPAGDCNRLWLPELAPSQALRERFSTGSIEWHEFRRRYLIELALREETCERLRSLAVQHGITLLDPHADARRNTARVLREHLQILECRRRWNAGWIVGGYTAPLKCVIEELGGLWFARHKVWTMPDRSTWCRVQALLPGDF